MDLSTPLMNGVDAVRTIRQQHPDARFIMLSAYDFPEDIQKSTQAGASAKSIERHGPRKADSCDPGCASGTKIPLNSRGPKPANNNAG